METRFQKSWWWLLGGIVLIAMIVVAIVLNFNYASNIASDGINVDNGDTKINWDSYPSYTIELSASYNISAPGTYYLSGSIEDGGISVKVVDNGVVRLVLNNISIKNSTGPAIACYSGDDLVIEFSGDNYLEDGTTYNSSYDEDVKGAIYSKSDLTLAGDGALTINANHQDGIVSKDDLKINGGIYNVTAKDDGIRGKDSVYIMDGTINVEAKGDGIKSNNETESDKGFVLIEDGVITILAGDDGIHAYNKLIIDNGEINIEKSYEGLEAQKIFINDGVVRIAANDDGINAGGGSNESSSSPANPFEGDDNCEVSINGGDVYINAAGDGIDSNGYIYFNGGATLVDGPTNSGNGALDAGAQIVMNDGVVIAAGASGMAEDLGSNSKIYNVSIFFNFALPAGTKIEIRNQEGASVIDYTSAKTFSHLAVGTSQFKPGETYNIYVDDEKYDSFTISNISTTVGRSNTPQDGPGGPGGDSRGGPRR